MTPLEICQAVLPEFKVEMLDEIFCSYQCNCSRERVERALMTTGREGLSEMLQDEVTEVKCHFCPSVYRFSSDEIRALLEKA